MEQKDITSINLSTIPGLGSCDSTRLQMSSKQMAQTLVHRDCDIPYFVSSSYHQLSNNSSLGIYFAIDDGEVIYKTDDFMILYYKNHDKIECKSVPPIKKTSQCFASSLRYCLTTGDTFQKNDIIYEYNEFRSGVPSFGYNTFMAYMNFFGFNHEDGLVISESFANRAKGEFVDKIIIPIYEYTFMQPQYEDDDGLFIYFPNIGEQINNHTVCTYLEPKEKKRYTTSVLTDEVKKMLKKMSLSDLFSLRHNNSTMFCSTSAHTELCDGKVSGIKIHKPANNRNRSLLDKQLENVLENIYSSYKEFVVKDCTEVYEKLGEDYAKQLAKTYLLYTDSNANVNRHNLSQAVYILELEIEKESPSTLGDKFCNRYAGKGVASIILPDEYRPIAMQSNQPIDYIYSPFGVFSRMNLAQLLEVVVSKNVQYCESKIKKNPKNTASVLSWLNNNIIYHLNDDEYFNDVKNLISQINNDEEIANQFYNEVKENNLYVQGPAFSETRTKELLENSVAPNETILITRESLKYYRDKLGVDIAYPIEDIKIDNVFCGPSYIMKLYKLTDHCITSRDLGPVRGLTGEPLRGRVNNGGSRLGQMEVEGIITHGLENSFKEIMTVKSDYTKGKQDMIKQLIETGEYDLKSNMSVQGGTKKVINTFLDFLGT